MNNENERTISYQIVVKDLRSGPVQVTAVQGTSAYNEPEGKTVVYTLQKGVKYYADYLSFYGSDYWVRLKDLGTQKVSGYVKSTLVGFDVKKYAAPEVQTPNPELGSNPSVTFNMWYFPVSGYTGVNYPTPLYYQYYYTVGSTVRQDSEKCTLLASVSGDYMYTGKNQHPNNYLAAMTKEYWTDANGFKWGIAKMARTAAIDTIITKAKSNLESHKPFLVGAQNLRGIPHLVVVTGYKNSGTKRSDFIVLDSCEKNFSNLEAFFNSFPNKVIGENWSGIPGGTNYVYGEY